MLGRLEFVSGGQGRGEVSDLYGLPVLRVQTDPEGLLGKRRLDRAGRTLCRNGAVRVLLPRGFDRWALLKRFSLRAVDPAPFLRAQAVKLALGALERREVDPIRATVALSGTRTDSEMTRAAVELCGRVRRIVIAAPGGERLANRLREEFGVPVLPPGGEVQLELRFHPGTRAGASPGLELYGRDPALDGLHLVYERLGEEDREDICLLCALWERGKLEPGCLKFI